MNPYLICCKNGVWDFKEKCFRQGRPDDYLSISTGIDYIPIDRNKDADIIEEVNVFMKQLFPYPSLEKYMWEHLASTLIGVAYDQTFNNYIGGGSNGKSVLTNLMGMVLGGYKYDLPHTAITSRERTKVGGLAPEITALKGKRYVVMAEPSKGDVINEGIMKQFTAGNDKITARAPYMIEALEFTPQFKLSVCANQTLKINTTDHGTWRRIRLVPFDAHFTNNPVSDDPLKPYQFKLIPDIEKKFDGKFKHVFFAMLVEIVLRTGGKVEDCDMVLAASNRYRESQDVIAEFINESYEYAQGVKVLNKTCVTEDFKRWHNEMYGTKGPQPKEVHEYMDKKFGKIEKGKWQNVRRREIYDFEDLSVEEIPEVNITD
jgi:P4 family phage/plasmid primase-like protien